MKTSPSTPVKNKTGRKAQSKTKPLFQVYLRSLGCPKNRVDSEVMLAALAKNRHLKWEVTPHPQKAQLIIINTCAFIDAAQEESVNTILELAAYKTKTKSPLLIVTGCLEQRFARDLPQLLPEVDLFLKAEDQPFLDRFIQVKNNALILKHPPFAKNQTLKAKNKNRIKSNDNKNKNKNLNDSLNNPNNIRPYYATHALPRLLSTAPGSAWLKIAEGCNRRCTFCAIPYFKGGYVSREVEVIKQEAIDLVKQGIVEINLVAQDLSYYGTDLGHRRN